MSERPLFTPTGVVNQRGRPLPGFSIVGELTNRYDSRVCILNATCEVHVGKNNQLLQSERPARVQGQFVEPGGKTNVTISVDLNNHLIKSIEEIRDSGGEIEFPIEMRATIAPVVAFAEGHGPSEELLGIPSRNAFVDVMSPDHHTRGLVIARDTWLNILKACRYSDIEVFELPTAVLKENKKYKEAISALKQAEQDLRNCNLEGVLANGRSAFEAVASAAGDTNDLVKGFEALWDKVLSQEQDLPKREPINDIIRGLGKFQHLGRHKRTPFTPVNRNDALLSLRVTLAVFEYVLSRDHAS